MGHAVIRFLSSAQVKSVKALVNFDFSLSMVNKVTDCSQMGFYIVFRCFLLKPDYDPGDNVRRQVITT